MDKAIKGEFFEKLVRVYIWNITQNGSGWAMQASSLCADKRREKKVWRELVKGGYIKEVEADETATQTTGVITRKAFDELDAEALDLASFYRFDIFDSNKGKVWVGWDQLTLGQKKTVILAVEADPTAYTLMACETRYSPPKVQVFQLGGGREAMEKVGVTGWGFYITDAGVREKDRAGRKAYYIEQSRKTGLNWYLKKLKAMEDEVPVAASDTLFRGYPALNADPESWPADLPATVDEINNDIKALRGRLEVLEKFEKFVRDAGGWENFLNGYNAAVEEYVENLLQKEAKKE